MKTKLLFTFLFITVIFYSCNEEPSLPKPKETDDHNLTVKLENIPESAKGKEGIIMAYKEDELYLTESFSLKNQKEVKTYIRVYGTYNIKAFIKKENKTWSPNDEDNSGWCAFIGNVNLTKENPNLNLYTSGWKNCENINESSGGSMTHIVSCNFSNPIDSTSPYNPNEIISVTINASDNNHSNISEVALYLDSSKITTMNEPSYYHDINTNDLSQGKHLLTAVAKNANNITASDEVEIFIEPEAIGQAPVIDDFNMQEEIQKGDTTTISARIYDPDGEIKSADLYIDDQKFTFTDTLGFEGNTYQREWGTTDYEVGIHEIKIIATDDDDNERTKRDNIEIIEE